MTIRARTRVCCAGAAGLAGEDLAPARRLRHAGRVERARDRQVAQVRQRREAVGVGDAGAGERPLERRDQILHRPFEAADERGRHAVRPGGDRDRLGAQVHAVRIGGVHPAIDVEQRDARAVDRDLDLLGRLGGVQRRAAVAVQRAGRLVVEGHAEAVLAVGREGVHRPTGRRACRRARPRRARAARSSATPGRSLRAPSRSRSPTASRLISAAAVR